MTITRPFSGMLSSPDPQPGTAPSALFSLFIARTRLIYHRADLQTAAALGRTPMFPLVLDEHILTLPQSLLDDAEFLPALTAIEMIAPGGQMVKQCFTLLLRAGFACGRRAAPEEVVKIHMNVAETAILRLLFDESQNHVLVGPLRPVLLAAHVFLYISMRQVARNGAVVMALTRRLEEFFRTWQLEPELWGDWQPVLLWALFVGVAAKPQLPGIQEDWMWLRLRYICRIMGVATKESLLGVLRGFLWIEARCLPRLDEFLSLDLLTGELNND